MAEQKATKQLRINRAFEASSKKAHNGMVSGFALMYLNRLERIGAQHGVVAAIDEQHGTTDETRSVTQ